MSELTIVERVAISLNSSECEKFLLSIKKDSRDILEIKNKSGRDECHSAAMRLKTARIDLQKTGKIARDDANLFSSSVIKEEKRLIEIIAPEESRLLSLRDAWDAEREAEREAIDRAKKEKERKIQVNIENIVYAPSRCQGKSIPEIEIEIEIIKKIIIDVDNFGDRRDEVLMHRDNVLARLNKIVEDTITRESEARAAADRLEIERLERLRIDDAQCAESRRLADEREEIKAKTEDLRRKQSELDRVAAQQRAAEARCCAEIEERLQSDALAEKMREEAQKNKVNREKFLREGPGAEKIIELIMRNFNADRDNVIRWIKSI